MATNTVKEISKEDVLKKQIADLEFEKKALADKVNVLEKEVEDLRLNRDENIDSLNKELDDAKKQNQDLIKEINDVKEFSDRRVKELEKALTLLNLAYNNISSTSELIKSNIDNLIKEVQS